MTMSDHQDSEHFTYNKTWEQIESLLDEAEREQNKRWVAFQRCPKSLRMQHWNRER
jgi:hypothetical protein